MTARVDVAIIGAGASGALTAIQIARLSAAPVTAALIEAGARAARGLAYGTPYGAHLLNVPAARMSALPEDPEHFLRWLRGRIPDAQGGTFAPRPLFGDYLVSLLSDSQQCAAITRVGGTAVGLTRSGDEWLVHLHDDRVIAASAVVLALGNLPPADPLRLGADAPLEYVRDPWAPGAVVGLAQDAPLLLIGSGLTAVDVAVAVRHEGHTGEIWMLSRNGRLPQPHAAAIPRPLDSPPPDFATPRAALRWIRRQVDAGGEWRAVIDSLRPHTSAIWSGWTPVGRGAFLRHARSLWEVHRHRAAPQVLASVDARVLAGHIESLHPIDELVGRSLEVTWRPKGSATTESLRVARVINCTGPASDYARVDLPLVVQMRRAGWLVPDAFALGIESDTDGALLGANGARVEGLFTLGPLRRPFLWESTAIPEIRAQAAALAQTLASRLRRSTPRASGE